MPRKSHDMPPSSDATRTAEKMRFLGSSRSAPLARPLLWIGKTRVPFLSSMTRALSPKGAENPGSTGDQPGTDST